MGELVAVGVRDGDELEECEVDGAVLDGESWELDGFDGNFWVLGLEDEEVDRISNEEEAATVMFGLTCSSYVARK
ncbi:unnamed protein product [Ilex paraguariensis]|uniref:Uncharacterized protein n=1 Tax=Ilex paraguariensis TaxID=185542 RepID=A0ABC8RF35_9AQUA